MPHEGRRLLVVSVAALGWDLVRRRAPDPGWAFRPVQTVFPALTCPVQASFRTMTLPGRHGLIANGLYFRELCRPSFWEQSAALIQGPRWWEDARRRGRRVGLLFWQQSLGEAADLVLSPKPIHRHHGGMIQDCYSRPADLYAWLSSAVGSPFQLASYWGPLASHRANRWIVAATRALLADAARAPDVLLVYLPLLDYVLQRVGPRAPGVASALDRTLRDLAALREAAEGHGYDWLVWGDYAMQPVTLNPVFPNRALRDAGLFAVRHVAGRAYPDFFGSAAFAMADHQVAHVYVHDPAVMSRVRDVLRGLPGVAEVRPARAPEAHARSGEWLLIAEPGSWMAYPWWRQVREAPDYAGHVDIHNKPGYDPGELFFGWPPPRVSGNPCRVRGTHGLAGPGYEVAWAGSLRPDEEPTSVLDLARAAAQALR